MKKVYILGSGTSRELRFIIPELNYPNSPKIYHGELNGPLSNSFLHDAVGINKYLKKHFRLINLPNLTADFVNIAGRFLRNTTIGTSDLYNHKEFNIESFHNYIENEIATYGRNDEGLNAEEIDTHRKLYSAKNELLEFIRKSLFNICYYCDSLIHRKFAEILSSESADIISFNWDILLELALYETKIWQPLDGYGRNFNGLLGYKEKINFTSKIKIFKPHGSINWYKRGSDELMVYNLLPRNLRSGNPRMPPKTESVNGNTWRVYLVPPAQNRIDNSLINYWGNIRGTISEAEQIIIIGFALNNFDQDVKKEIEDVGRLLEKEITLVAPDAQNLIGEYHQVFPRCNIRPIDITFSKYLKGIGRNKNAL